MITCLATTSDQEKLLQQSVVSAVMGTGACHYGATKMKKGLEQWLGGRRSRWEGIILDAADVVRILNLRPS